MGVSNAKGAEVVGVIPHVSRIVIWHRRTGVERAAEHERDTIAVLNAMGLRRGDIIYFSPLVEHEEVDYPSQSARLGFQSMDGRAMRQQQQRIRSGLVFGAGAPLISIYDIRDFIY